MAQIQIEQEYLTSRYELYGMFIRLNNLNSSFSILEAQPMDMLLGLDMLKKHQVAPLLQVLLSLIISSPSAQLISGRTA